jgi:hypothetical protein|tara:strand:- start:1147 stop:1329 length:183 start_codon:yes stop_codon:yes gene_type:complete
MSEEKEIVTTGICSYCRIEERVTEEENINDFIWLNISNRLANLRFNFVDIISKEEDDNEK